MLGSELIPFAANILFGLFALSSGFFVITMRKKFPLYLGIIILLLAVSISSISNAFLLYMPGEFWFKLHYLCRAFIPIYLFVFVEYILKIWYKPLLKSFLLSLSLILFILSFTHFVHTSWYLNFSYYFTLISLLFLLVKLCIKLNTYQDLFLTRCRILFIGYLIIMIVAFLFSKFSYLHLATLLPALEAFLLAHIVLLIITTGYTIDIRTLFFSITGSIVILFVSKLFISGLNYKNLILLFLILITYFSISYSFTMIFRSKIYEKTTELVTRFLKLPLDNIDSLTFSLLEWDEIKDIQIVQHTADKDQIRNLNNAFKKMNGVVYKNFSDRDYSYSDSLNSGFEILKYYFKKHECDYIFQVAEDGRFYVVKLIPGLNPVAYNSMLLIIGKTLFSIHNKKTM